jgi:hypothetical protein
MLPENATLKIAAEAGIEISDDFKSQDTISIIVRRNKKGGVDDPTGYIINPENCIVIALTPNEAGLAFSEKAQNAGVPPENIYLLPAGQQLDLNTLIKKVNEIKEHILGADSGDEDFLIFDEIEEPPKTSRIKVIAVRGFRGGVGTTTIATGLAALLHDNGGKIAVLDLGLPPNAKYHCGASKFDKKDGFLMSATELWDLYIPPVPVHRLDAEALTGIIEILRKEYRWVVVDFSPQPDNKHVSAVKADKTIIVVDSDILQSVEPAAKAKDALFVYNKVIPDISADIIEDILNQKVITVKTDFDGCYAALAAGVPAIRNSEEMAVAIGRLASQI